MYFACKITSKKRDKKELYKIYEILSTFANLKSSLGMTGFDSKVNGIISMPSNEIENS